MRILGLCLFLALFLSDSFAKDWKGIVPCVSSRSDVEKLLGKDEIPNEEPVGTYHRGKDRLYIDYYPSSTSKLKQVVRSILVYPDRDISFRKYIMRLSDFDTTFAKVTLDPKITHIAYLAHYQNNSEGFEIVTQINDKDVEVITAFRYYGKESDCSKLP